MISRLLVPSLLALCAAAASAQPADDHWRSTPWPSTSQGGIQLCFLGYENGTRIISVTAMNNGNHFISISDPAFNGVADGASVSLAFPSGWRAGVPSRSTSPGNLLIGIDRASFDKVLDELATGGTLTIASGAASIAVAVPEQLDGRIGNLRGPLPEGSPLGQPCIAQFTAK